MVGQEGQLNILNGSCSIVRPTHSSLADYIKVSPLHVATHSGCAGALETAEPLYVLFDFLENFGSEISEKNMERQQEGDSDAAIASALANSTASVISARANREALPATANEIPEIDFAAATSKPLARDYYVAAKELRSRYNVGDFDRSIALFEKAIKEDPNYAAAYAMLASACQARSELDPSGPWLQKGNAAAESAIRLAPTQPEAQRAQAGIFRYRGQLRQALDAYVSAYELDQTSDRAAVMVGRTLAQLGRPDLALRWYQKAVHREPRPGLYSEYIGDAWSDLGDDTRAEPAFHNALTFRPDLSGASIGLARLALLNGQFDKARQQCREAEREFKNDWEVQLLAAEIEFYARNYDLAERLYRDLMARERAGEPTFAGAIRFVSAIGFLRRRVGQESEGRILVEEARTYDLKDVTVAPDNPWLLYSLAADCAALEEHDSAMHQLENAIAAGWIDYRSLSLDPRFDSVRKTPRFQKIFLHLTDKVKQMDASVAMRMAATN